MFALGARTLEVFAAVAETGSATLAATALNTSQPNVTRTIAELERRCGLTLFERGRFGMSLTPEGEVLLAAVQRNFSGLRAVERALADMRTGAQGLLTFMAMPVISEGVLGELTARFVKTQPGVTLRALAGTADQVVHAVLSAEADFGGVVGPPPANHEIEHIPLARRSLIAVVGGDHRLANRDAVHFRDLDGETFIGVAPPHHIRTVIDNLALDHGIRPARIHDASTQRTVLTLVQHAGGIGFVDSEVVENHDPSAVQALTLHPEIVWDINLIFRRDRRHSKTLEAFLAWLREGERGLDMARQAARR